MNMYLTLNLLIFLTKSDYFFLGAQNHLNLFVHVENSYCTYFYDVKTRYQLWVLKKFDNFVYLLPSLSILCNLSTSVGNAASSCCGSLSGNLSTNFQLKCALNLHFICT